MDSVPIPGVTLTSLKLIEGPLGTVFHGLRCGDETFRGFGEAYFSTVHFQAVKGWRRHREITLNLVVPVGEIRFVIYDDRRETEARFWEVCLSPSNYCRLTVSPMLWMAFQGHSQGTNLLLNVIDQPHDPKEADARSLDELPYNWS